MSWKPVLLTAGNKPPQVLATVNGGMLKLQISPEIAQLVGLTARKAFAAYIGTTSEQGQIKLAADENGGGRVKGGGASPIVYIPAETSWQLDANTKCDFEIRTDEKELVINMPWYKALSDGPRMHGNQRVNAQLGVKILDQYRRGVSRRKLAEHYNLSEATIIAYTNAPEDVTTHMAARQAARAAREAKGLLGNSATQAPVETAVVTKCPPRPAAGLRKPAR